MNPSDKIKFQNVLTLSPREYQVLLLAGKGMHMGQIAARIGRNVKTVATYVQRICEIFRLDGYRQVIAFGAQYLASGLRREPLTPANARYRFVEVADDRPRHCSDTIVPGSKSGARLDRMVANGME